MKYKQLTTRNQCMRCYHILHVTLGVPVSPLATFTHYFEASQPLSNSHSIEQAHPSMDNITPPEPSYILYHIILYHFAYSRTVPVRFVSLRFVSIPKPSPSPPSPHFTQLHTTCKRHATKPNPNPTQTTPPRQKKTLRKTRVARLFFLLQSSTKTGAWLASGVLMRG
jgi:hypothetical protein